MHVENFWADVEVEEAANGAFVPVLVIGLGGDADQVTRVQLAGSFALPDLARNAALEAITAIATEPGLDNGAKLQRETGI